MLGAQRGLACPERHRVTPHHSGPHAGLLLDASAEPARCVPRLSGPAKWANRWWVVMMREGHPAEPRQGRRAPPRDLWPNTSAPVVHRGGRLWGSAGIMTAMVSYGTRGAIAGQVGCFAWR